MARLRIGLRTKTTVDWIEEVELPVMGLDEPQNR